MRRSGTATRLDEERVHHAAPFLCFSHLRWNFVYQRPQHLMSRFASQQPLIFWEEPLPCGEDQASYLDTRKSADSNVLVVTPMISNRLSHDAQAGTLRLLLDELMANYPAPRCLWYYTPMMLPFSEHLVADCVVYDCMDELANFRGAPTELLSLEDRLIASADLVFTGGYSLYEAKRDRHPATHAFPSAVDAAHFGQASRAEIVEPVDQAALPGRRLGFFGAIDERIDLNLIGALADARPDCSIVMIGPVVKISEAELPRKSNIHYLGPKAYAYLPAYLSGWDVALMPFAINEATRFISPTKTPEYLAAGRPVVSTPIVDVLRHYGALSAVKIAQDADAFIAACDEMMARPTEPGAYDPEIAALLDEMSWDRTQQQMAALIDRVVAEAGVVQQIVSPTTMQESEAKAYDVLIVGGGFAGAVMAERLAADAGKRVLVVDRRPHIGGNAFDCYDEAGILIHQYGPHIFHTNSDDIVAYLSRFTRWHPYEHRVLADVDGMLVPMPINRTTLNALYDCNLANDEEAASFLAARAEPVSVVRTSADVVISAVGRKSVTARVPTRTSTDDRYFTDSFQAMPADGYTAMFEKMLDHPNIDLLLGVNFADVEQAYDYDHLVFTGPIDEYFGHCYGKLPYRSLQFVHETRDVAQVQPVAVINYPSEDVPYTRVTEYKHLTGQTADRSSITYEYPSAEGDPYYPIPRPENQALFKRYEALALAERNVTFVGRLATYRYYNMDQVVGQALATYRRVFAQATPAVPGGSKTPRVNIAA